MVIVRDVFQKDPLSGHLFVFFSMRRDRVRIVYWDRDGFAMWTKRLERRRFRLTSVDGGERGVTSIEAAELGLILEESISPAHGVDQDGRRELQKLLRHRCSRLELRSDGDGRRSAARVVCTRARACAEPRPTR